uniref:Uncharacterized protein n=1 Tax=Bactrocera dorsalis TaxID=27457 RepID=A0A034VLW2_BACDO
MRRNHFDMPDSTSPNTTSPPRLRQRMNSGIMLQRLTATIAETRRNTYNDMPENPRLTNIVRPWQNEASWETETQGNPWAYNWASDDESNNNSDSDDRYDNNEFTAISKFNRNRRMPNAENNSVLNELNVITDDDQLPPLHGFMHISPQSDDEDSDEPSHMAENEETLKERIGFCPIPQDLLCDEGVSFNYNDNGNYGSGYADDVIHDYADYDDDNPSTSKRALEKLFILQTSVWMDLPNFVIRTPAKEERAAGELSEYDLQQIRLGYSGFTL